MAEAILVRVRSDIEVAGSRAFAHWIVRTGDKLVAESTVREKVSSGCVVEATDWDVTEETIKRLGLAPCQAWHL
jgi:hypothetical protein